MAVNILNKGYTLSKGVDYTVTVDNSGDYGSVSNATYFLNLDDNQVRFKDGSGVVVDLFSAPPSGNGGTVSGTQNTIAKFTGTKTVGDSNISDTGSLITLSSRADYNTDYSSTYTDRSLVDKQYVDNVAQGLKVHDNADVATTQSLQTEFGTSFTYNNGASGSGATLESSTNITLGTIDGYTASLNETILVKNEATSAYNGLYVVTQVGTAGVAPIILTRRDDFDSVPTSIDGIHDGDFVFISHGDTLADTGWVQTTFWDESSVVGTTDITWIQFSSAGVIEAGTGLSKTGTTISLDANLNDLSNVDTSGVTTGQVLTYDGATWSPATIEADITGVTAGTGLSGGGSTGYVTISLDADLNDLNDATITSATTSQTLYYDGANWINSSALTNDGTDISVTNDLSVGATLSVTQDAYIANKLSVGTSSTTETLNVGGNALITSSTGEALKVVATGQTQTVFVVEGTSGELFAITDDLTGTLFSVNDISGLPILEVNDNNEVIIGDFEAPALNTTKKHEITTSGANNIYGVDTTKYDGAYFDYVIKDGTNYRAGSIQAIWDGTSIQFNEVTTNDIGNTTDVVMSVVISGTDAVLRATTTTTGWTIKTIIRSI